MKQHQQYMQLALKLAKRSNPSPNPKVGCVIVKDGIIVGKGYHKHAGSPHAEILALKEAGNAANNATAYVTLEPCCHFGKTAPCTDALIAAGIKEVVAASEDPNPLVAGKGFEALRRHNIHVDVGIDEAEAKKINEVFFHYIQNKKPFVTVKWAMSLDGKTIPTVSDSSTITNPKTRLTAHRFRSSVDAILIGANTAKLDNPLLTARHTKTRIKQPIRIVLSSTGDLPTTLSIFDRTLPAKTILVTTPAITTEKYQAFEQKGIDVLVLPANDDQKIDLHRLLIELGKQEISSLLVEGGMQIVNSFFAEELVNKVHVYLAPNIIATLRNKHFVNNIKLKKINTDFYLSADY